MMAAQYSSFLCLETLTSVQKLWPLLKNSVQKLWPLFKNSDLCSKTLFKNSDLCSKTLTSVQKLSSKTLTFVQKICSKALTSVQKLCSKTLFGNSFQRFCSETFFINSVSVQKKSSVWSDTQQKFVVSVHPICNLYRLHYLIWINGCGTSPIISARSAWCIFVNLYTSFGDSAFSTSPQAETCRNKCDALRAGHLVSNWVIIA